MASAMSASAEWNPNAIRCSSLILVLVDSISALDSSWVSAARIAGRCLRIRRPSATKAGIRQRARPGLPAVQRLDPGVALDREHVPQALFEQVGAVQPGVGLGDPGQLVALALGEVLRVLPQRVAGMAAAGGPVRDPVGAGRRHEAGPRCAWARRGPGREHRSRPGDGPVERLGGPGHDVERRPRSAPRSGSVAATTSAIQSAASARHVGDLGAALGAELVEEPTQGVACRGRARPTPAAGCRGRPPRSGSGGRACS